MYAERVTSDQLPPDLDEAWEGGDPACWAGIVCQECGAVLSEGHRAGCPHDQGSRAGG
jgi:hypothetical protein